MGAECFADRAKDYAGLSARLLGWRPDEFWRATPEELATVFAAFAPKTEAPPDAALIAQLKDQFPDGQ